ncbi:sensor histidine kinase [Wenzhouxiangella marina]|uniref:sensor histidine kinase n=1 Tax=Wenzhouxiangella marina TaxID=1579979 RepID=UPI0006738C37|nr:ATP-binding protein [Wenzhouxiangella marina]MBB6088154.1 nitrogen fixation/metabolism regulation signal transduction histidine kinase [Wenzhouxiangella marina]
MSPPPRDRRLAFETRLLLLALASGAPAVALVLIWLHQSTVDGAVAGLLLTLTLGSWLGFAIAARRYVVYHLQTLSNLMEALREGDYSLRGRRARFSDSLGEVVREINQLAESLRLERLGAREASALLAKVIDVIDISVFAFSSDRRLQLINPAGERLLDRSATALAGQPAALLGLDDFLDGPVRQTVHHHFPVGRGQWEIRRAAFREDGMAHELLVITDLSWALREQERRAWQRLIRVISHELNNSLAPIQSMSRSLADLIEREPLPEDWREDASSALNVIGNRAESLGRFMAAYALLARLPEPKKRAVAVKPLIERAAALDARRPVRIEGTTLNADIDADQIEQLLINLLKNAQDAAEQTDGEIEVRMTQDRRALRIEVLDSGPGIANPDNLFVPFFTTKPGGTGIGLVLCRQIAEGHGGSLSLENRDDGPGCVARLTLPKGATQASL